MTSWIHRTGTWVALAVTLATSAAYGQTNVDVEGEHARGMQAREAHRDQEAFDIFRALYERSHEPRALARMALAEGALARWVEAERHLVEALGQTGDPWITQSRAGLEAQLATMRTHLANLEVSSNAPSARWSLDGVEMPALPLARPVRVAEGPHVIDVSASGYDAVRRSVTVPAAPGGLTREAVILVRAIEPAAPPRNAPVLATPTAPVTRPPPTMAQSPVATAPEGSPLRALGITSLVLGGVGVGVGVLGWVLRDGNASDFNAANCWTQGGVGMGGGDCASLYDTGMSMNTLAIAGAVVGGVFLAGGVALLAAAPSGQARSERAWSCGGGPGTLGVRCWVAF